MVSRITTAPSHSPPISKHDPNSEKDGSEFLEDSENQAQVSSSELAASRLSETHREYLLQRHGTLDLDPLPSALHTDPYNWPTWKVSMFIILECLTYC